MVFVMRFFYFDFISSIRARLTEKFILRIFLLNDDGNPLPVFRLESIPRQDKEHFHLHGNAVQLTPLIVIRNSGARLVRITAKLKKKKKKNLAHFLLILS